MFDTRSSILPFMGSAILLAAFASSAQAQQGGVTNFCSTGANGARISATGSADLAANGGSGDLVLHADNLPMGTIGLFFQGNTSTQPMPLGLGFRCVSGTPQVYRIGIVATGPGNTQASKAIDYLALPSGAQITPGSLWNYQFWFRDGNNTDLTDALEIQFVPPSSIGAGTVVTTSVQTGHPLGDMTGGGALVIDDAAEFSAFWAQHSAFMIPPAPEPVVDFSQDMVVAVFSGPRSTGGYSIEMFDMALSVTTLSLTTVETGAGPDCPVAAVITRPMQVVRTPRVAGAVIGDWNRIQAINLCP